MDSFHHTVLLCVSLITLALGCSEVGEEVDGRGGERGVGARSTSYVDIMYSRCTVRGKQLVNIARP